MAEWLATELILLSQHTPFRGEGSYGAVECVAAKSSPYVTSQAQATTFPQAAYELARFEDFFTHFATPDVKQWLQGRVVLDLGCGYGGRTVGYAVKCRASTVIGVEVFPTMVARCTEFAASQGIENCHFLLATQDHIPLPTESVDIVVSYDVLEHVADPRTTLAEIHRILRPHGRALLVFSPYYGMLHHHLGYITKMPGIHWLFSATTLINAINPVLTSATGQRFKTAPQPLPGPSYNGRRVTLPNLNGLTGAEFLRILNDFDFEVIEHRWQPVLDRYRTRYGFPGELAFFFNRMLTKFGGMFQEAFSGDLSCILEKRA